MTRPRIVALAGGPVGVAMLDVLEAHGERPVGVIASHAAGAPGTPCPFTFAWCARHDVPHAYWPRLTGQAQPGAWLAERRPELLLSLSYDLILPAPLLAVAARAVNVHRGIAPDFRGAYSTLWALERGASHIGVTVHEMVAEVDAGPVLAARRLPVEPELTAAEALPMVEGAAVDLLDEILDDLVGGRLPSVAQEAGGEVFGRVLPSSELEGEQVVRRVRARYNPPYPPPYVDLGARRFELVEQPPPEPEDGPLSAVPSFMAPSRAGNAASFTRGLPAAWTSTAEAAAALALSWLGRPLALPELAGGALLAAARAAGADVITYPLGADLEADPGGLAAAAEGRTVVLNWICGRPPSRGTRALARARAVHVLEDRTQALLDRDPVEGDAALLDLAWTGSLDGAAAVRRGPLDVADWAERDVDGLARRAAARARRAEGAGAEAALEPPDLRLRPISRTGAREALLGFDAPAARAHMERAAGRYAAALGAYGAFTHWPPGSVAHGFPIVVGDAALRRRLDEALPGLVTRPLRSVDPEGASCERAEALLALPCHGGVRARHVASVVASLNACGVDVRTP